MHKLIKFGMLFIVFIVISSCSTSEVVGTPSVSTKTVQPILPDVDLILPTARLFDPTPTPVQDIQNYDLQLAAEPILPGIVDQLFVTDDQAIWLASDKGLARIDDDREQVSIVRFWDVVVGDDRKGLIWAISENGAQISAWDGNTWTHYRDGAGWVPLSNMDKYEALDFKLFQDSEGRLWLKTKTDIRSFANNKWYVFTLGGMGFSDRIKKAMDYSLSFAISDFDNSVWVGVCYFENGIPVGGQGARYYDNQKWAIAGELPDDACVSAIAGTSSGVIVAVQDQIVRYDLKEGHVSVDTAPGLFDTTNMNYGYVADLAIGPDDAIWPLYSLCGEAGCGIYFMRYKLTLGNWLLVDDLSLLDSQKIFFTRSGGVITINQDQVRLIDKVSSIPISNIKVTDVYQNSQKDIWLLAEFNQKLAVWKLVSPDE